MPIHVMSGIAGRLEDVPEQTRRTEALGYNMLSAEEVAHEPFGRLTLAAEHSQEALLTTSIAVAFPRAPYIMASTAWALQRFSGGRFVLGLGTQVKGRSERQFSAPWAPPGPRLRDYIRCMRAIWDTWQNGTTPAYEGEFYRFTLLNPNSSPGPIEHPNIEIVISAVNPFNARLAGEECDGVAIHSFSTFRYTREVIIPRVQEGARRAGRDPNALHFRGGGFVVTGRTEEEVAAAREKARQRLSYYGSTRSYAGVMRLHGWDDDAAHLHRLSMEAKWDEMVNIVTDDMIDEFCVIGTWDEMPAKMREKYAGITTELSFPATPTNPDEEDQIREIIADLKTIPAVGEV
jgi:probable F420-dependent oxidoreductase